MKEKFPDYNLAYVIGGQISIDVFPKGWDKTYCLQFLTDYEEIYFFGDKTFEGGNDHEIYEHIKPTGRAYSVKNPAETINILHDIFLKK